eukprot:77305-Pyramimonas_sp.AAC.1
MASGSRKPNRGVAILVHTGWQDVMKSLHPVSERVAYADTSDSKFHARLVAARFLALGIQTHARSNSTTSRPNCAARLI